MSDGIEHPAQPNSDGEGSGVLANLPRTRPQRASPRRAAARRTAAEKTDAAAAPARSGERSARGSRAPSAENGAGEARSGGAGGAGRRSTRNRPAKRASAAQGRARRSAQKLDAVPSQGYESDDEATGAVQPPGGAELLISAAEIVGELAKAGASRSERLVKDVLSRLPLS
ncbi:MAG TPA: hypothetical protein VNY35_09510 [Solirubrobacteraceae bacterium]|jgi:hypothetical protein|nr:hypothetical protein [Solirubrobacteraceae bacterium]